MKNLRIYFALTLLNNFWFITSNWLNFWLKYMSLKEVGLIDGIAFMIGIMFEFPSGIISDRLGRKNSLILAQLLQFSGSFIISFATNLYEIGVGFIIFQIGISMYTGSVESFGYEVSLKNKFDYVKTLSISSILNNFGYLFSLIVGGYLYLYNQNYPNYLFTFSFFIGLILSFLISEPKITNFKNQEETENKARDKIEKDEKSLIITFKSLNIKILLYLLTLSAIAFSFDFGFLKLLLVDTFSNINNNYWYIFGFTILSLIISNFLLKLKSSETNQLRIMFLVLLILIFLTYLNQQTTLILFGYLTFLAIYLNLFSLNYFNKLVSDSNRASFLSLFSFGYKLPYVFLALILGEMLTNLKITSLSYPAFLMLCGLYLISKLGYNRAVSP